MSSLAIVLRTYELEGNKVSKEVINKRIKDLKNLLDYLRTKISLSDLTYKISRAARVNKSPTRLSPYEGSYINATYKLEVYEVMRKRSSRLWTDGAWYIIP